MTPPPSTPQHRFVLSLQPSSTASHVSNANTASIQSKGTLPAFLSKLYGMVTSPDTDPWVYWNVEGTSFIIPNSQTLAEHVLGRHFKHNRFASFVRQLNMYGFHKVPHLNHGVLLDDGLPEVWEFTNEHFRRDEPEAMRLIVRKKGEAEKARSAAKHQSPSISNNVGDPNDLAIVRAEIQTIARRQQLIREELNRMSASTEKLWECALESKLQHQQQQGKIDKMIKFLSEVFMKRSTEIPHKTRGLLEGPNPFEEIPASPASSDVQMEVMKMIANGKLPVAWLESLQNVQQWLPTVNYTVTPTSETSPVSLDSAEALNIYQAAQNYMQSAQTQGCNDRNVNHSDADVNVQNDDFADFITYPPDNLYYPFTFSSSDSWQGEHAIPESMAEIPTVGNKRTYQQEEDAEEVTIAQKRARV